MSQSAYPHLLSPGRIGAMELRNRIVVMAMGVNFSEEGGFSGDRVVAYHEEQARGGAGLIISGACGVMYPVGQVQPWQIGISDDKFIPGLKRVVDAVHRHGAKYAVQLHQGGLVAGDDTKAGRPQWCPSVPEPMKGDFTEGFLLEELQAFAGGGMPTYKVLTHEDIQVVVNAYAAGARRAQQAGCDGVEIHGGHGYLLSSFLSPRTNKRTDEYGGSTENRSRFLVEVVRAVRAAVGPDFAMWVKLDSQEVGKEGGITIEHAKVTAKLVEEAGADAITVSAYHDTGIGKLHSASNIPHEPNTLLPAGAAIKAVVGIPIICSGRVEPEHGDAEIRAGRLDFLGMGRKLLADPELPNKLAAGKAGQVRPCIYCYTCVSAIYTLESTRCAVNAECGIEYLRLDAPKPAARRRVVVVGGGPGGMESARRLARDGHEVILIEKGDRLGGTLRFASLAYAPNERLLDWLRLQVEQAKIEVRLNTVATSDLLTSLKPDDVIVATGALRNMPSIPGGDTGARLQRRRHAQDDARRELGCPAAEDLAAHAHRDEGGRGDRAHGEPRFRAQGHARVDAARQERRDHRRRAGRTRARGVPDRARAQGQRDRRGAARRQGPHAGAPHAPARGAQGARAWPVRERQGHPHRDRSCVLHRRQRHRAHGGCRPRDRGQGRDG